MTPKENFIRTAKFDYPEYIPMQFHINPACWEYYPQDAVVMGIVPAGDEKMKSRVLKYLVKKKLPSESKKNEKG